MHIYREIEREGEKERERERDRYRYRSIYLYLSTSLSTFRRGRPGFDTGVCETAKLCSHFAQAG